MSKVIQDYYDRCGWERAADGDGYVNNRLFADELVIINKRQAGDAGG